MIVLTLENPQIPVFLELKNYIYIYMYLYLSVYNGVEYPKSFLSCSALLFQRNKDLQLCVN